MYDVYIYVYHKHTHTHTRENLSLVEIESNQIRFLNTGKRTGWGSGFQFLMTKFPWTFIYRFLSLRVSRRKFRRRGQSFVVTVNKNRRKSLARRLVRSST